MNQELTVSFVLKKIKEEIKSSRECNSSHSNNFEITFCETFRRFPGTGNVLVSSLVGNTGATVSVQDE